MEKYISIDDISAVYNDLSLSIDIDRIICSPHLKKALQEYIDMAEIIDPYLIGQPFKIFVDDTMPENAIAFGNEKEVLEKVYIKHD